MESQDLARRYGAFFAFTVFIGRCNKFSWHVHVAHVLPLEYNPGRTIDGLDYI